MALPIALRHVQMVYACPHCAAPRIEKGSWFTVMRSYRCKGCEPRISLTYGDKLNLFQAQMRRLEGLPEAVDE